MWRVKDGGLTYWGLWVKFDKEKRYGLVLKLLQNEGGQI